MEEFASLGYLLVREVIPRGDVAKSPRRDRRAYRRRRLADARPRPAGLCSESGSDLRPSRACFYGGLQLVAQPGIALHAFVHHPALLHLMEQFVGPRVLVRIRTFVMRVVFPNCERIRHRIHQDHEGVRGTPECFTAWTPFHDCSVERGALQLMEASHHFGLQTDPAVGHVTRATARGGDWVGGQINAGDVLLMHSLTVHEPALNTTSQFRLSIDFRFQDCERDFQSWQSRGLGLAVHLRELDLG